MILKIENLIEFLNSKEGFYCSRQDMKKKLSETETSLKI